jgi:hypothetical protein
MMQEINGQPEMMVELPKNNRVEKNHSRPGTISFGIALASVIFAISIFGWALYSVHSTLPEGFGGSSEAQIEQATDHWFKVNVQSKIDSRWDFWPLYLFVLAWLAAVVTGFIGLLQKDKHKALPIAGLILCTLEGVILSQMMFFPF